MFLQQIWWSITLKTVNKSWASGWQCFIPHPRPPQDFVLKLSGGSRVVLPYQLTSVLLSSTPWNFLRVKVSWIIALGDNRWWICVWMAGFVSLARGLGLARLRLLSEVQKTCDCPLGTYNEAVCPAIVTRELITSLNTAGQYTIQLMDSNETYFFGDRIFVISSLEAWRRLLLTH